MARKWSGGESELEIRWQRSHYRPRPVDHSICASERTVPAAARHSDRRPTRRCPCQGKLYLRRWSRLIIIRSPQSGNPGELVCRHLSVAQG